MENRHIAFSPPDITEEEIAEVADTLRSGWITTGPKTKKFENEIAAFCHTSKAVCLNSATACAEMSLRVLGIGPGDEVITSAYTYTASASVAVHVGATLVLVDTQPDSYEMDYEKLESAITEKTKAIIPVDLGGVICDYDKIYDIVEKKKSLFRPSTEIQKKMGRIAVVADGAHAFGATKNGKHSGEIADFTSFSFHAVKNLTTAEGTIVNRATAIGKDPRNEEVTGDGEVRVDTEEKDSHLTVSKETTSEPENGEKYALGETINYLITVTNDGNLTLTNVKVTDELTGDEWTIDELAPGEEETFDASYTVKESDLGKTVVNVATATGTTPDPDIEKPDVTPGETEDPVEEEKPALAIDKKVVDPKEEYQIGEVVTYEITVTNIGNVTQKNILVEDQMKAAGQARITNIDGANGISNGKQVTLDKLVPGAKATITVEYTIVYDDRGNTITNAAVADGEGENPVTPDVPVVIEKVYNINVVHEFAPNNEGDVALLPEDYTIENLKPNTEKSITAEAVKGYVAYPSVQNVTVVDKDITVTFQYYKDVIGTDPTDPEKPDGVSDEFQVVVRFAAVNGTVSTDRAVVTLVDKNGKPAKDGVGHLTKNQIAAATANTGYDQSSLSWTPGEPTITYDITGEMTFTATFTATPAPAPAPTEPTTPPARPTRPTTCTTAPTGNATVENAVTPSEEKVEEKAAEIKEVLKSDDDKVPVANQKLDDLYSGDAKKDNPVI